jgi:carbonic anhydrase
MRRPIPSLPYPHLLAAASLLVVLPAVFASTRPGMSADDALARLKAGNARFVKGRHRPANYVAERATLIKGQQPYAILLTCSDSRVPPELIFDESLGKLFIVRVAGNVTDPVTLGSVEYAAEHLGAHLLVVLGHDACGAVKATVEGGHLPPNIEAIAHDIQPAADRAKARHLDAPATLKTAIAENVRQQMGDALGESEVLREMVEKKSLTIVGGVYNLASGRVEWLQAEAVAVTSKQK